VLKHNVGFIDNIFCILYRYILYVYRIQRKKRIIIVFTSDYSMSHKFQNLIICGLILKKKKMIIIKLFNGNFYFFIIFKALHCNIIF